MADLTPRQIVTELDRYIIGQDEAKRAVAIALRNRIRRSRLPASLQQEVTPKNILMIGPTGVGKTEIARRLARLVKAPFIKVEATRFTEVGYVGRDAEGMIRDLTEQSVQMVTDEMKDGVRERAEDLANERLLELLVPGRRRERGPLEGIFGPPHGDEDEDEPNLQHGRGEMARRLRTGLLEEHMVEIEVEGDLPFLNMMGGPGEEMGLHLRDMLGSMLPRQRKRRMLTVREARRILIEQEAEKLLDHEALVREAVRRVEQNGLVFIDEIDKICARGQTQGPDVSREGVQRDILPIVEGSTVQTKHGTVRTDHILFIAAGAFHVSRPSDLIPELQGRFPIRVELKPLTEDDFRRILTEPQQALLKQYEALLAVDGVQLRMLEDGIAAIARIAQEVNRRTEDIGARRLHTLLERCLEDVLFAAPDVDSSELVVDRAYVEARLGDLAKNDELSRFIL